MSKLTEEQKAKAFEIISDHLEVNIETINDNSLLKEDLGADSLDEVELTIQFENEFDIQIPDSEVENIKTVKDFLNVLESLIN